MRILAAIGIAVFISLVSGASSGADENDTAIRTQSGTGSAAPAQSGGTASGTTGETAAAGTSTTTAPRPAKKLEKPEYPIEILSTKAEEPSFSKFSSMQARPEYTQLPEKELLGLLAGEYNDFAAHVKKAVRDAYMTPGEKKLSVSFDAKTKLVSVEANNVPFNELASAVAECASVSLVVTDKLSIPVTMNASDVSAKAVLYAAAAKAGFVTMEDVGIIGFKEGGPGGIKMLWFIPLPDKVEPAQCRMYYNKKEDLYYGEIIIFHKETAAVHLVYVIEQKKMIYNVKKLSVFATVIPDK